MAAAKSATGAEGQQRGLGRGVRARRQLDAPGGAEAQPGVQRVDGGVARVRLHDDAQHRRVGEEVGDGRLHGRGAEPGPRRAVAGAGEQQVQARVPVPVGVGAGEHRVLRGVVLQQHHGLRLPAGSGCGQQPEQHVVVRVRVQGRVGVADLLDGVPFMPQ